MGFFGRGNRDQGQATDEQALARYRYLLRTAPPEEVEQAHEEAFAQLTPEQRRQALTALAEHMPPNELRGDDPASLARAATRAEMRQPGTIERAWGGQAAGGFGLGSFFLSTLAASFIGTAIASRSSTTTPERPRRRTRVRPRTAARPRRRATVSPRAVTMPATAATSAAATSAAATSAGSEPRESQSDSETAPARSPTRSGAHLSSRARSLKP